MLISHKKPLNYIVNKILTKKILTLQYVLLTDKMLITIPLNLR